MKASRKKAQPATEDGSILVVTLVMLVLLTIVGIAATDTATIETRIAGNIKTQKIAFYAAESAKGYVAGNTDLYHGGNLDPSNPSTFTKTGSEPPFEGDVTYAGATEPPRRSGYEAGKYKAHRYRMDCTGYGPSGAESDIRAGFYRIGF